MLGQFPNQLACYQCEVHLRLLIRHKYNNHEEAECRAKMGNGVETLNKVLFYFVIFKIILTFLTVAVENIFLLMRKSEMREKTILQAHMLA